MTNKNYKFITKQIESQADTERLTDRLLELRTKINDLRYIEGLDYRAIADKLLSDGVLS